MVSSETARTAVGILGNVVSLSLYLSPLPTFIRIWKKGTVGEYSAAPYLATFMNCMVWLVYGLPMVHPHSTLVITINVTGCAIEIVCLTIFIAFSHPRKRIVVLMLVFMEFLAVTVLTILILNLVHTYERRSTIVGTICILCTAIMYAAPLSVMKLVIQTKSVEYMPLFVSLASFANSLIWASYALVQFDVFIIIPNGLGIILSGAQLVLYGIYCKSRTVGATRTNKDAIGMVEVAVVGSENGQI